MRGCLRKDIYAGLQLHLASLRRTAPDQLASGPEYEGNVIVHPSAKIGKDCKIGPNVSIGIECVLENGCRVANSVLLHRVKVSPPCTIKMRTQWEPCWAPVVASGWAAQSAVVMS